MEAIERYLNSFGQSVVNKSKGILKKKKKVVTGTLLNSISYTLSESKQGFTLKFLMADYVMRGIAPRDEKGRFISRKSLKFLIARKIYTQGKEGISFFQKPLKLEMRGFTTSMGKALKEDIINTIEK